MVIVSEAVPFDLRWSLRFRESGWILHSQQSVTGEQVPTSSVSQFSSCCLDRRLWSPGSPGPQWCGPACAPLADSWGAEMSTTLGCLVQQQALESCRMHRYVPSRFEDCKKENILHFFRGVYWRIIWLNRIYVMGVSLTIWRDKNHKVLWGSEEDSQDPRPALHTFHQFLKQTSHNRSATSAVKRCDSTWG